MNRVRKLLFLTAFALIAINISGCKKAPSLRESDLSGTWYADIIDEQRTIQFTGTDKNTKYISENFFDRGTYEIKKDGTIRLINRYNSGCVLTPLWSSNGELCALQYTEGMVAFAFTREARTVNLDEEKQDSTLTFSEKQYLFGNAVKRILEYAPWPLDGSDSGAIVFSDGWIYFNSRTKEDYNIATVDILDGGYIASLVTQMGEYCCRIYPLYSVSMGGEQSEFPTAYRLEISHNGSDYIYSTREGYVSMSTG